MTRKILSTGLLAVVAGLLTGISVRADDPDPALFQDAPANSSCGGSYWCTSAGTGIDPNTDDSTLEFILNAGSAGVDGITTPFATGWVEFYDTATSKVLDYLDFTTVGGKDAIFLYCNNAYCGSNDAGLPSTTPSSPVVVNTSGSTGNGSSNIVQWTSSSPAGSSGPEYIPMSGQPGYGTAYTPNANGVPGYTIIYAGSTAANGSMDVPVPEPSALMLLSSMMIGLAAFVCTKFSARA